MGHLDFLGWGTTGLDGGASPHNPPILDSPASGLSIQNWVWGEFMGVGHGHMGEGQRFDGGVGFVTKF